MRANSVSINSFLTSAGLPQPCSVADVQSEPAGSSGSTTSILSSNVRGISGKWMQQISQDMPGHVLGYLLHSFPWYTLSTQFWESVWTGLQDYRLLKRCSLSANSISDLKSPFQFEPVDIHQNNQNNCNIYIERWCNTFSACSGFSYIIHRLHQILFLQTEYNVILKIIEAWKARNSFCL